MPNATDYRNQAARCRKAANLASRPTPYLLNMAEHCDRLATQLETQFAGDKPGIVNTSGTEKE